MGFFAYGLSTAHLTNTLEPMFAQYEEAVSHLEVIRVKIHIKEMDSNNIRAIGSK